MRTLNILDPLAVYRLGAEGDEINRMSEPERIADLADELEAADIWSLARARINDDDRPLAFIELDAGRGKDTDQRVVDRRGSESPRSTNLKS